MRSVSAAGRVSMQRGLPVCSWRMAKGRPGWRSRSQRRMACNRPRWGPPVWWRRNPARSSGRGWTRKPAACRFRVGRSGRPRCWTWVHRCRRGRRRRKWLSGHNSRADRCTGSRKRRGRGRRNRRGRQRPGQSLQGNKSLAGTACRLGLSAGSLDCSCRPRTSTGPLARWSCLGMPLWRYCPNSNSWAGRSGTGSWPRFGWNRSLACRCTGFAPP